jgi:phosphatidylglycerol---prolipoprotein diacylglyceryl transferase
VHPVLFTIPGVDWPLHLYGVLIVSGFLAAMYVAWREAKRQGAYADDVLDFAFWALLGGMVGARIVFIIVNWQDFFIKNAFTTVPTYQAALILAACGLAVAGVVRRTRLTFNEGLVGAGIGGAVGLVLYGAAGFQQVPTVIVFWKGGLVFYGAALGGFVAYMIYCSVRGIRGTERLRLADMMIVGLPLAHVFGRLGCVAAGCCWGDGAFTIDADGHFHSTIPFALEFPKGSLAYSSLVASVPADLSAAMQAAGKTYPLIPVQLIESLGEGLVFFTLLFVRSRKWFHGQVLLTYGILYPILRSTIEVFRGDGERGWVIKDVLSTSQGISLAVAAASLIAIFVIRKQAMARLQQMSAP